MPIKERGEVTLEHIDVKETTITIIGDSDLVLNKMNARITRELSGDRKKVKAVPNPWEDLITAVRWRDPLPCNTDETYEKCDEEMLNKLLRENAPCFSGFGLKKAVLAAVTQNEIDKYSTKIAAAFNVSLDRVPIRFTTHSIDERLMSPKRGSPVLVRLHHFAGWSAEVPIRFTENVYSISEIINFINLAGFGNGIGSGRSSGFGRFHVATTADQTNAG